MKIASALRKTLHPTQFLAILLTSSARAVQLDGLTDYDPTTRRAKAYASAPARGMTEGVTSGSTVGNRLGRVWCVAGVLFGWNERGRPLALVLVAVEATILAERREAKISCNSGRERAGAFWDFLVAAEIATPPNTSRRSERAGRFWLFIVITVFTRKPEPNTSPLHNRPSRDILITNHYVPANEIHPA